jgi:hypothetical protein
MALILSGTDGVSDVDGSAATPAVRGSDANTGMFFPAADTIAFAEGGVEAMRLDSAGNVGIGTSSPGYRLDVNGIINGNNSIISRRASGSQPEFVLTQTGVASWAMYNPPSSTDLRFNNGNDLLTLNSSGNLGIGTTSPVVALEVLRAGNSYGVFRGGNATNAQGVIVGQNSAGDGLFYNGFSAGSLLFSTNATERARITSGGALLLGTTNTTFGTFAVYTASTTLPQIKSVSGSAASTSWHHFNATSGDNNVQNIIIYGNGNIQNANNSYGSLSDAKLKENIVDATPKLEKLNQVRVVTFNLKGEYEQHKQIGVIAQELEQIFPGMVDDTPDRDAEGNDLGTTTKSVKYSVFVPMLIKAMQEQQAIITALTARVSALEGN